MDSLKTKKEFDFVYKHGFSRYSKGFTLYVCKIPSDFGQLAAYPRARLSQAHQNPTQPPKLSANPSKLGLSISRKVGNAVVRNLLKRRVRMLCREYREIAYGFGLVFVAKVGVADMSFAELQESFHKTLAFILQHLGSKPARISSHHSGRKAHFRDKESKARNTEARSGEIGGLAYNTHLKSWQPSIDPSALGRNSKPNSMV